MLQVVGLVQRVRDVVVPFRHSLATSRQEALNDSLVLMCCMDEDGYSLML